MKKRLLVGGIIVLAIVSVIVFWSTRKINTEVLETSFYEIAKNTRHFSREKNWQGFE